MRDSYACLLHQCMLHTASEPVMAVKILVNGMFELEGVQTYCVVGTFWICGVAQTMTMKPIDC